MTDTKAETATLAAPVVPSAADYAMISEANLFHPERRVPPEKAEEKVIPKPEIVLYGTLITGDTSVAFIEDKKAPRTTPGRGKRQTAIRKGDNVGGYVLRQIEADRIILVKGDDQIVVKLEDAGKIRTVDVPALPGSFGAQPGAPPTAPSSLQAPAQKAGSAAVQVTPGLPRAGTSPEPGAIGTPGIRPFSRQEMLLEVQGRKQEMRGQQNP